ncbi:MAG: glycosyltransferase family 2 protein [Caulobacteraceae bacterium]
MGDDRRIAGDASVESAGRKRISCVVCAYNEEDRIRNILDAVDGHPALAEVIVVNDGSTDRTEALLRTYSDVRVISYAPNRGKTYALSRGIAAAKGDWLMLLDADLAGVTAADIDALADPVVSGQAEVAISLRQNSLGIYRRMGLDFVSGERVIPTALLRGVIGEMQALPRWGGEAFMNERIIAAGHGVAVVKWPAVVNVRKYRKLGRWRGFLSELAMIRDALGVISPWGVVRQNFGLLRLIKTHPARIAARRPHSDVSFDISFVKYFLIR